MYYAQQTRVTFHEEMPDISARIKEVEKTQWAEVKLNGVSLTFFGESLSDVITFLQRISATCEQAIASFALEEEEKKKAPKEPVEEPAD